MARGRPDYGLLTIPTILQASVFEQVQPAAGTTTAAHTTVGTTKFRYYLAASIFHTDSFPRYATIYDVDASLNSIHLISSALLEGAGGVNTPNAQRGPRWSLTSLAATGSLATVTKAAASGFLHVAESISFSAGATAAPAAQVVAVNLIDGVSGGAANLWRAALFIAAAAGQSVPPFGLPGLFIAGSNNTAMTLEFGAAIANLTEAVTLSGYDIPSSVGGNQVPNLAISRSLIVAPGHHLLFAVDGLSATASIVSRAEYIELDFTSEIPNL